MRRYVGLLLLLFFTYSFAADVYHVFPDQMVFVGQHGLPETQLPQNIRVVGYIYNPSGDVSVNDALNVDSGTLYVDASNNRVGIGTTSPGGKLEIAKVAVSANEDALRIGIDEEYDARIKFFDDDDESNQYA
ncbi:MAG TPA: hypothetical protein ENF51_01330, partial [Candidatus Aenigmarchaeota archaeon]|nr:hypothetical protein [Candidatus Aenigmarchaeota archaeon]